MQIIFSHRCHDAVVKKVDIAGFGSLAYSEYGVKDGSEVVYCHGFPASRLEAVMTHDAATLLGLRIIIIN